MSPKLSIVLVAINNLEITKRCISSLEEFTRADFEVVIVDNASSDTTAQKYYAALPYKTYRYDAVVSLSEAWNKGIEMGEGTYIAVINNDTVVPPDWDVPLLETLTNNEKAGMVSPLTFWLLKGHFNYGMFPHFSEKNGLEQVYKLKRFEEIVWGEFCVFKKEALTNVGGFNPIYERAGSEDLEMVFQLYNHGYDIYLDPRVSVWHQGNASRRDDILPKKDAEEYEAKNFDLFLSRWPQYTKDWK